MKDWGIAEFNARRSVACPKCGAPEGLSCRTTTGYTAKTHEARRDLVREALNATAPHPKARR